MFTYEHTCPKCKKEYEDINNYYCIQNKGFCETCLRSKKNKRRNILKKRKEIDLFAKWRKAKGGDKFNQKKVK